MNRKLPLSPFESDAFLYIVISVLLLFSVNKAFSISPKADIQKIYETEIIQLSSTSTTCILAASLQNDSKNGFQRNTSSEVVMGAKSLLSLLSSCQLRGLAISIAELHNVTMFRSALVEAGHNITVENFPSEYAMSEYVKLKSPELSSLKPNFEKDWRS